MLWDLLCWLHDVIKCRTRRNKKEVSAKTAPRVNQAAARRANVEFAELGRVDVVFRGRIRPDLLEHGLSAMLEQADASTSPDSKPSSAQPTTVTPRMLMEMFPSANVQEHEARATLQHILDGFDSPSSSDVGDTPNVVQQKLSTVATDTDANVLSDDDDSTAVVHPVPTPQAGPNSDDAAVPLNQDFTNVAESTEIQRMAAQLAALEHKLDLLLQRSL